MNIRECIVRKKLENEGWKVLHKGWPDFICWRGCGYKKEVKIVEVKKRGVKNLGTTLEQQQILYLLSNKGIRSELAFSEIGTKPVFVHWSACRWETTEYEGLGVS